MANKIKDTDYLAISARVRAMETTLLTAERMERLLEARSDEEVSKLLQDCGYPELDAARPEAMDAALSQAREELLTDLGDGAPDPRYIDIFKLKYDYHNAKAILKAAAMGTSPDRMLMDMGRIGAAELKTAVESGELDKLPGALPAAVAEAKSVLDTTRDPQLSDIVLDRWMYRDMVRRLRWLGVTLLLSFISEAVPALMNDYELSSVFSLSGYSMETSIDSVMLVILGLVSLIVGEVFAIGLKMKEEQDLTI